MSFIRASFVGLVLIVLMVVVSSTSEAVHPLMTVAAEGGSDLSVTKIGPSSAPANSNVSFSINVTNGGPDAAPIVTLQDVIPAGMTFVSVTETSNPQVFTCGNTTPVPPNWNMCTTNNFAAGASSDFTVVLHVGDAAPGTTFTNVARVVVTSNTPPGPEDPPLDPNDENNSSAAVLTTAGAASADLSATKSGPSAAPPNSDVQFSIVISNLGPNAAQGVSFSDTLPGNMTFVSLAQNSGPVFNCPSNPAPGSGGTVTCTLATMNSGASASFTLTTHIPNVSSGTDYTNELTVTSTTPDPNTENNEFIATVIVSSADISITKIGPTNATAGDNISWTLNLANAGPETAANAAFVDQLPVGTTFVSLVQNNGPTATICNTPAPGQNGQVSCGFSSLNSGASAQFTLTAAIDSSAGGSTLNNTANASSDNGDSNTTNNSQTVLTTVAAPPGGVFAFNTGNFVVTEDAGKVDITVKRNGPKTQAVTVDYATSDTGSTATERKDYTTAIGTLTFAANEDTKTFTVLVEADSFTEGSETVQLTLSNATGGALLGVPQNATVRIDDSASPAPDALRNARNFVRRHYHDFLNREPDTAGLDFWTEEITDCGSDASCLERKRVDASASFFLSIEFQETGFFAIRSQRVAFGKLSQNATRLTYQELLRDSRQLGEGVVIPDFTRLEQNKLAYTQRIVGSAAFATRFPQITAADYVDALYSSAAVTPTTTERNDAIAAYGAGGTAGRVAAFRKVVDSNSVRNAEFRQAFVLMEYHGYLRRTPDQPGYDFWLGKLNTFNGNFVDAEMVKAFIVSIEYKERYIP